MTENPENLPAVHESEGGVLYRWRWWLLAAAVLVVGAGLALSVAAVTVGLPSIPAWLPVLVLAFLVGQGAATLVAVPLAITRSNPPEQHGVMHFDMRKHPPKFAIRWLDPDEYAELDLLWGDTTSLGTTPPIDMVLMLDYENLAAIGTHRSVMSPDELERKLFFSDEIYSDQEEELVELGRLRRTFKTKVRKAAEAQVAAADAEYDEMTMPNGTGIKDFLDSMSPERPDEETVFDEDSDGGTGVEEDVEESADEVLNDARDLAREQVENDD